jgi:hypothetical protein
VYCVLLTCRISNKSDQNEDKNGKQFVYAIRQNMAFTEHIFTKLINGRNCAQEETACEHFAMGCIFDKPQA